MLLFEEIISSTTPILEKLIDEICNDFADLLKASNIDIGEKKEELRKKYLFGDNSKKVKKLIKKIKPIKKRKSSAYSLFLSDKEIFNKLREEHPDKKISELMSIKCKMWKTLDIADKQKYIDQIAELEKKKEE